MVQANEILMLILTVAISIAAGVNYGYLRRIPWHSLITASFAFFAISYFFTVAEGFFLGPILNSLEHIGYAVSTALLAYWCRLVFGSKGIRR